MIMTPSTREVAVVQSCVKKYTAQNFTVATVAWSLLLAFCAAVNSNSKTDAKRRAVNCTEHSSHHLQTSVTLTTKITPEKLKNEFSFFA